MSVCYSNRFISNELKTFVQKNGVKHIFTEPYQPSSNGMAERSFQILKCAIKKITEGKNLIELNTIVSGYLLHYIATAQSTTGKSLAEMLFNRKLNTWHNLLKQSMNKPDLNNKQQIAEFYALKTSRAFHLKVWCGIELTSWEKRTIIKQLGPVTYLIDNSQNIFRSTMINYVLFIQTLKSIMKAFVKPFLQRIQIIKYSRNNEIPMELHLLTQILSRVLSVKMGQLFQHLNQTLAQP